MAILKFKLRKKAASGEYDTIYLKTTSTLVEMVNGKTLEEAWADKVDTTDARLSDARKPLAHIHTAADLSGVVKTETDPTVPSWAKQATKPSYTADEVGADAEGTADAAISAHLKESNPHKITAAGIGALTAETDPTVPSWAKQASKPTYTAAEVHARPDTWTPTAANVGADPVGTAAAAIEAHLEEENPHNITAAMIGAITKESDPTVPSWAKATTKPTYTAAEVHARADTWMPTAANVGADPAGTAQGLLDEHLEASNPHGITAAGIGALTKESDPTVPAWAKAASKPAYTASEVGARPNTWTPTAADVGADPSGTAASAISNHLAATNPHKITLSTIGAAAASHGTHVPTPVATASADNATFLRNDNTWQKVTAANIGAVPTSRTINSKALTGNINLTYTDVGAAAASHGSHVPTPVASTAADNTMFLRNDNTWAKVTAANIGAAAASHGTHVSYSTTAPAAAGTASAGSASTVARSDHVHPAQTSITGNAASATKLATARIFPAVNLAGTGTASFDGSANPSALGVSGTLPLARGGTGATSAAAALASIGAQGKASVTTLSITSQTQSFTVSGILSDQTKQLIIPCPAVASQQAYMDAGVRCNGQSTNSVSFTANSKPSATLTVYLVVYTF